MGMSYEDKLALARKLIRLRLDEAEERAFNEFRAAVDEGERFDFHQPAWTTALSSELVRQLQVVVDPEVE